MENWESRNHKKILSGFCIHRLAMFWTYPWVSGVTNPPVLRAVNPRRVIRICRGFLRSRNQKNCNHEKTRNDTNLNSFFFISCFFRVISWLRISWKLLFRRPHVSQNRSDVRDCLAARKGSGLFLWNTASVFHSFCPVLTFCQRCLYSSPLFYPVSK